MNPFNLEVWDDESRFVTFYSVRWEGDSVNESAKFFMQYENDPRFQAAFRQLVGLLFDEIGDTHGAKAVFFNRRENDFSGLPAASAIVGKLKFDYPGFPFRLYCLRLSNSLVILFGGGRKTAQTPQASPDLAQKFEDAKLFTKRIKKALSSNRILISPCGRKLLDRKGNPSFKFD